MAVWFSLLPTTRQCGFGTAKPASSSINLKDTKPGSAGRLLPRVIALFLAHLRTTRRDCGTLPQRDQSLNFAVIEALSIVRASARTGSGLSPLPGIIQREFGMPQLENRSRP